MTISSFILNILVFFFVLLLAWYFSFLKDFLFPTKIDTDYLDKGVHSIKIKNNSNPH